MVIRNVEHVCHEIRKHLLHLAEMAKEAPEVAQHLQDRTTHLQEHVDDAAEALLRQVSVLAFSNTSRQCEEKSHCILPTHVFRVLRINELIHHLVLCILMCSSI